LIKNTNHNLNGVNLLDNWLKAVDKYADLIVMIDDNSTDGTFEKCKAYSDKVIIKKSKYKDFYTEEQYMQQEVWELIRKNAIDGDWVLAVDSDEFMEESFIGMKQSLMKNKGANCYSFQFIHVWTKDAFRVDDVWGYRWAYRMFRFYDIDFKVWLRKGIHFGGLPEYVTGYHHIPTSCGAIHYGYYPESMKQSKSDNYLKYSKGGDLVAAKTIMDEKIRLITFYDRKKIMRDMKLPALLNKNVLNEFKQKLGEASYESKENNN